MDLALTLLAVTIGSLLVHGIASRLGALAPLLLLAVGAAASFVPAVPDVNLSPDVVLIGLLPPLLYATAISTSLIDLKAQRVAIAGLSVGLVLFTALGVAVVASALLPINFALAFALGAIVAPPDAVAATAVARSIGLPRRVVTLLEGESLLNDATALVSLRTALAAAVLAAAHSGQSDNVSVGSVAIDFLRAAVGGAFIGFAAYKLIALARRRIDEPVVDTTVSFAAPFIAYLPAELLHSSGVIAVVTTGLLLGHRSPVLQDARSRLSERSNWTSIQFILENAIFLVIGLQLGDLVDDVQGSGIGLGRTLLVGLAVLVTVLVLRPLWIFPFRVLRSLVSARERKILAPRSEGVILSWAGMRGVVTLAAALLLPPETPHRPSLVLIAMVVMIGSLLLQGTTLPALSRALGVRGPDPREDALQEATVIQAAVGAGLRRLEELPDPDEDAVERLQQQARMRVNRVWERLGRGDTESPSDAYRCRAARAAAHPSRRPRRPRGPRRGHDGARRRGVDARVDRRPGRRGAGSPPARARADRRRVRAPGPPARVHSAARCRGLRGVPARWHDLAAPAGVSDLRPRRLLRLVSWARERPLRGERPPGHALARAGRGVAVVLRRRDPRAVSPPRAKGGSVAV